jgi:hypothetical protein
MKKLLLTLLLSITIITGFSQTFGNRWIDYSKQYYKFQIIQDGIYRIDYNALSNEMGALLNGIDPNNFQIYGREDSMYIYVHGEADGSFDQGDYIEFYAQMNNGWLDTMAFDTPSSQADKYYSLYNDTATYYLTWNNQVNNRRMVELNDNNFTGHTPINYFWKTSFISYFGKYLEGVKNQAASSSLYTAGEGWFSGEIEANSTGGVPTFNNSDVSTPDPWQGVGAPDATATAVSAGASYSSIVNGINHHLEVQYGTSNIVAVDTSFLGYQLNKLTFNILNGELGAATTRVRHQTIAETGIATDYQNVSSVTITYPHASSMGGASSMSFDVPQHPTESKTYLSLSNFSSTGAILYELTDTVKRISITDNAGNVDAFVPNHYSGGSTHCFISDTNAITYITDVELSPITFVDYGALQLDSAYVIVTNDSLMTEAVAYGNYRSSFAGGSHSVVVVDVDQLYHQFGAGIGKCGLAVRRFCDYLIQDYPSPPQNLFLIGKSIREAREGGDQAGRRSVLYYQQNFVPSFGYPSSDNLITTGLNGTTYEPAIPTGRLAAQTPQDVTDYLSKMMEYEQQQQDPLYTSANKDWMKHVLQFGGGGEPQQQDQLKGFLRTYQGYLEDTLFAGAVTCYSKTSDDPFSPVEFDEVNERIEKGVSIMNFFGHASPTGFDINIDDPQNWTNQGKYPFLLGLACHSGDIHLPPDVATSTSESFVMIPDRGVIAFLSTVKLGFIGQLDIYCDELMQRISNYDYGESIGTQMQNTIAAASTIHNNFFDVLTYHTMTLHGDPALKVNSHAKPEIEIDESSVYFTPEEISLTTDSFDVNVILTNLGAGIRDTFSIEVTRHFPNGNDSLFTKFVYGLNYKDTIAIRVPVDHSIATGINNFEVRVDIPSFIDEQYDEVNNNQITVPFFIALDGIIPIYPYEYAIVPNNQMTLKASTVNPLDVSKEYVFEVDTTDLFDSPFRRYQTITSSGGVVEAEANDWLLRSNDANAPLTFTDSTVYWWRVSHNNEDYRLKWEERSFQYINGKRGWGQAHFFQYKNNDFQFVGYERTPRLFTYDTIEAVVDCHVDGGVFSQGTLFNITGPNGQEGDYGACATSAVMIVVVIDPVTLSPWYEPNDPANPGVDYGHLNYNGACRTRPEPYFQFQHNVPEQIDSTVSFLENHIPDGHYVLVYSSKFVAYNAWGLYNDSLYSVFQSWGADSVYLGQSQAPWIFFTKKGDPSFNKEIHGTSLTDVLDLSDTIYSADFNGVVTSEIAGPAYQWNSLYWEQHPRTLDNPTDDASRIRLIGIKLDGTEDLLLDTVYTLNDSINNLTTFIDANVYPYAKLQCLTEDSLSFTPAQLDRWQLIYDPVPETALNAKKGYHFTASTDTLSEGEEFEFAIAIENVSEYDMDSMLVQYWVEDVNRVKHYLPYDRQDSLLSGEILLDTITVSSAGYPGLNSIWIESNPVPLNSTTGFYDQLEQYHFNNIAQVPFNVEQDEVNPLLDVTFDGVHIMDGDLVSGKPHISITLDDENPYLIMDSDTDTSNFFVYMTPPNGIEERIYFTNGLGEEIMSWIVADDAENKFYIEYDPILATDGFYTMRVQAKDKSNNDSGDLDYIISFEVVNASTITEVMNYPNPFSTRTQFVFTLTGNTVPDYMKIQIMTITGKVVREITTDELGAMHVGRNRTEYWWDGRDEFGDQLANGIYLYRVIAKINGENIDKRETGADQFFHKGFGKMYLMR